MSDTVDVRPPPPPSLEEFTERGNRNPFAGQSANIQPIGALTSIEQQRGIAEVQARMLMARANPRDQMASMDAILRDCTRPTLAQGALYQYSRGGSSVSGPSIKLAEAVARRWGNIASGIKEVSRANGYSECISYAWDLETGYYDERQFQVRHWRDTKSGGYALTDERDIYELIANMGQRRKRAVLLTVIPDEVIDAAEQQCEETLRTNVDSSPEALRRLVEAFARYNVTKQQIEARCQCRLEAIRPAQIVQLRKVFTSLKDDMSEPGDWFGAATATAVAWSEITRRHEASAEAAVKPTRKRNTPSAAAESTSSAAEAPPSPAVDGEAGTFSGEAETISAVSSEDAAIDAIAADMQRDIDAASARIKELALCTTLFDLERWNAGAVMKAFGERLAREGKVDLLDKMRTAYRRRQAEIGRPNGPATTTDQ